MSIDDTQLPSIDESARRRFELAWREGRPEPISQFLPATNHVHYRATLEELVCIEMEFAWKHTDGASTQFDGESTNPARLHDYLARFPVLSETTVLVRLVRHEYEVRHRHGDRPAFEEYRLLFPNVDLGPDPTPSTLPNLQTESSTPNLPGFEVLGELGRGGMGVVYKVRESGLERVVALKTVRTEAHGNEAHSRFLMEAQIAARLDHPGVVPVHGLGRSTAAEPYYTMKLVRGQTFDEAIRRYHANASAPSEKTVEWQRLLNAFLTVSRTIAFAHSRGVIHRDLKPANIVLGEYGETVVLDWGLAKVLRDGEGPDTPSRIMPTGPIDATIAGSVMGTPAYMSPEQASGRIELIDERSDQYSLGAILFQALTGRRPYLGDTSEDVIHQVLHAEPPRPRDLAPTVPRALEAICLKAMAKNPAARFQDVDALTRDLESYLAGEPVSVYREGWRERLLRRAKRHRLLVASGSVAMLVLSATLVVGLFLWQREKFRFAQREQQQSFEHRVAMRNSADEESKFAAAELRADRFASASQSLARAVKSLESEIELAPLRLDLDRRRTQAQALADFYRTIDRAEYVAATTTDMAFTTTDREVLANCRTSLAALRVFEHPDSWWLHLPADGLAPDQLERLKEDVATGLGLLALWEIKRGFLDSAKSIRSLFGVTKDDPGAPSYRAARETLRIIRTYRLAHGGPSQACETLDFFCRHSLGLAGPNDVPSGAVGPADAYYLGITHFFLGFDSPFNLGNLLRIKTPPDVLRRSGLDFQTPMATSERLLRTAIALRPRNYWAHNWLAYCQFATARDKKASPLDQFKALAGAEQTLNGCIGLRPENPLSYSARADAQLSQLHKLVTARWGVWSASTVGPPSSPLTTLANLARFGIFGSWSPETAPLNREIQELYDRTIRGLLEAERYVPADPSIQYWLARTYLYFGDFPRGTEAMSAFAGFILSRQGRDTWDRVNDQALSQLARQLYDSKSPNFTWRADYAGAVAMIRLANNDEVGARELTDAVLKAVPDEIAARTCRGIIHWRHRRFAEAIADFDLILTKRPRDFVARLTRAHVLNAAGRHLESLAEFDSLLFTATANDKPIAMADWQRLEVHLGRAGVLPSLNRDNDADLEAARQIDPNAIGSDNSKSLLPSNK